MNEDLKKEFSLDEKPRSKIPGFRSGKLWKKVTAVIGYAFIGLFVLAMVLPGNEGSDLKQAENATSKGKNQLKVSQAAYVTGVEQYNNNNFDSAITSLEKVIPDDQNYQDAQVKIAELKIEQSVNYLASAKENLANNEFKLALADINKVLEYDPNNQEAATIKEDIPARQEAYEEQKAKQEVEDYKTGCETIEYRVLNKNPDSLKGTKVELRGEIMQIQEDENTTFMLLSVTHIGYDIWDDNVAVFYDGSIDAYQDDIITIWGEVKGKFSYESQAGWNITVPEVSARYVSKG